jgi:hypothetical protein
VPTALEDLRIILAALHDAKPQHGRRVAACLITHHFWSSETETPPSGSALPWDESPRHTGCAGGAEKKPRIERG